MVLYVKRLRFDVRFMQHDVFISNIKDFREKGMQITPPGKPSTWFPGEGLVTQADCSFAVKFVL